MWKESPTFIGKPGISFDTSPFAVYHSGKYQLLTSFKVGPNLPQKTIIIRESQKNAQAKITGLQSKEMKSTDPFPSTELLAPIHAHSRELHLLTGTEDVARELR